VWSGHVTYDPVAIIFFFEQLFQLTGKTYLVLFVAGWTGPASSIGIRQRRPRRLLGLLRTHV
jgi:hypothetical protein